MGKAIDAIAGLTCLDCLHQSCLALMDAAIYYDKEESEF